MYPGARPAVIVVKGGPRPVAKPGGPQPRPRPRPRPCPPRPNPLGAACPPRLNLVWVNEARGLNCPRPWRPMLRPALL